MFKSKSLDWSSLTLRDMIWVEAALFVDIEMQSKIKEHEMNINVDIRALLKDLDDVQRIKATGKKNSLLSWDDLPSQRKQSKKSLLDTDPEVRKEFLRDLSKKYKNK